MGSAGSSRQPTLVDVILGSMSSSSKGKHGDSNNRKSLLVDVGAGYGLVSLAAASEGHRVVSFELGPKPLEALKESIKRNNFEALISVQEIPLGSPAQAGAVVCLQDSLVTDPVAHTGYGSASSETPWISTESQATSESTPKNCLVKSTRQAGHEILSGEKIGALRISASGWDGHVMEGFLPLLQPNEVHRPHLISMEWNLDWFKRAGYQKPLRLVETLYSLGYRTVIHRGSICDWRWVSLNYNSPKQGSAEAEGIESPTWCSLDFEDFRVLLSAGEHRSTPETLLFLLSDGINGIK
jgi:hypothetical protein